MPTDLFTLLHRDHDDLLYELTQLLEPTTPAQLRGSLDAVRLGLTAHAEAEDIVLARFTAIPSLEALIVEAHEAHMAQEGALSSLVTARPGTAAWRERAAHLRELVRQHSLHEEAYLLPALRLHAPRDLFGTLAGAFATERLRQLAMLQPSAPIFVPEYAEA